MAGPERAWASKGEQQLVDPVDRTPDFDPRTGDHLWIVVSMYRVNPDLWVDATHTPTLDGENLLTITVPGCFYCERPWTTLLASRRCKGEPDGGR